MKTNIVMEVAIGKVKAGVSREAYLEAARAIEADLRAMPGYRSRQLLAGEDGLYIDLLLWNSLEEALQAMQAFEHLPSILPMMDMLDMNTAQMYHLEPIYQDVLSRQAA